MSPPGKEGFSGLGTTIPISPYQKANWSFLEERCYLALLFLSFGRWLVTWPYTKPKLPGQVAVNVWLDGAPGYTRTPGEIGPRGWPEENGAEREELLLRRVGFNVSQVMQTPE